MKKELMPFRAIAAIAIFVMLFLLMSLRPHIRPISDSPNPIVSCDSLHRAYDTLLVQHTDQLFIHIDSIQQLNILNARKTHKIDSLQHLTDSLSKALFLSNYRIHQARYYLKICVNNPSQTKFLKGWMNRALNE